MDTPTSTQPFGLSTKKRTRSPWRLLRAAVFMICCRSTKKPAPVNVGKGVLNKLIAVMRLLHRNFHRAPASLHTENHGAVKLRGLESLHGVFWLQPPPLPLASEEELEEEDNDDNGTAGNSCDDCELIMSADSESQYSPAVNFVEIDSSSSSSSSPVNRLNAIDLRAEEFIASFYEQIRLQRLDSLNRYNEMIERGS